MFYRNIIKELRSWANDADRKPMVLRGARQVGKSTAVNMFAADFDQYIVLNLEHPEDADLFHHDLPVGELIRAIHFAKNKTLSEGRTLLFIDEIQNSPKAVAMLRYFYEDAPDIFVIAAGSLFEVMIAKDHLSFPVGRVRYAFMYPLTFEEFLGAVGETQAIDCCRQVPVPEYALPKLMKLFHEYAFLGGMPEVIRKFSENRDIAALKPVYQGLITAYMEDTLKYARNPSQRQALCHAIRSAPTEAGKRIKFQGFGNSDYRSREMGESLRTLESAMLIYLLYPSSATEPPIRPDLKKSPRLQFLDTGLIHYSAGLQDHFFTIKDLHAFYQGLTAEHIVGQELIALDMTAHRKPVFWTREEKHASAEVDFIISHRSLIIPVEVKAGKTGTLRSLHQFMERSPHSYAVRMFAGPVEKIETVTPTGKSYILLNMPYFLAGRIHEYIEWLMK